jgi:hypothetical protein
VIPEQGRSLSRSEKTPQKRNMKADFLPVCLKKVLPARRAVSVKTVDSW